MKTILLFAVGLLVGISGFSQNTGIGTTTPQATLDIKGNFRAGGTTTNHFTYDSTSGKFTWFRNNGTVTNMIIDQFGLVGIGISNPQANLHVNGSTITNTLTIANGGSPSDLLIKSNVAGQVGFRKGHVGLGISYIIAIEGNFPSSVPPQTQGILLGEIRLFTGNYAPAGWAFCNGQILPIVNNQALFAILGTTYGGNGQTNFALPDLRDAVPVHVGPAWLLGERSN